MERECYFKRTYVRRKVFDKMEKLIKCSFLFVSVFSVAKNFLVRS